MHKACWALIAVLMLPALALAQHGHSPYAGQDQRAVKALSDEEIQALLDGQGMGLAKAAELNHYPGPKHTLELATELQLSEAQRAETRQIYNRMHQEAVRLGALIIDGEKELDHLFATQAVDSDALQSLTKRIAQLRGDLRLAHLQAHIDMKRVLSPEQINKYDALRGYVTQAAPGPHSGHHRHR
jgi:Spy/CpxP family protein refolding chaperone